MSEFQRLCLLRCFRIDRIYRAVVLYVSKIMSELYVQPPIITIDSVFEQSTPTTPVVFILSPGADPAGDLFKLAERLGTEKEYLHLFSCKVTINQILIDIKIFAKIRDTINQILIDIKIFAKVCD